jgi:3-carboxy-cis,cis-muconate cycloisomerase
VRRPSSSSDSADPVTDLLGRGGVRGLVGDRAWLAAMVEVEVALARTSASLGIVSASDAAAIEDAARRLEIDVDEIAAETWATGTPVVPLVGRLRAAVGDAVAPSVHRGATSQDIVDTASMLVVARAVPVIVADLRGASDAAAGLARAHRSTPIAGRTLLQQAVPTTFGLKAAGWMSGLDRAIVALETVTADGLAVQLGGAAGTLAGFEGTGRRLVSALAGELGLRTPVLPWHTDRTRIGALAGALGLAAGAIGKPARDVILLAQTEVGEVAEGVAGRGGSSAMPHKRNPVAAVAASSAAMRVPGLVSTLLAAMPQEHERAAGAWQAEWVPVRESLLTVGSAAAWLRDCLEHLEVRPEAMRSNLGVDAAPDLGEAAALVDAALRAHGDGPPG